MSLDSFLDERFQSLFIKLDEILSKINAESSREKSLIYDTKSLASKLKVSTRTLQNWRDKNMIEFDKIGGKIIYTEEHVMKFLKKYNAALDKKEF